MRKILCFISLFLMLSTVGCTNQTPKSSTVSGSTASTSSLDNSSSNLASSSSVSSSSSESSSNEQSSSSAEATSVTYKNSKYGFLFTLPDSWSGYTIVNSKWNGNPTNNSTKKSIETGPILSIRSPKWTAKIPRQDIPIMIFTLSQWNLLQKEEFSVSAAPMNPKELGRNSKYVFALPARYNFAFLPGNEEVDTILEGNPLKTF